jgi:alkylation response protein AidB-like acyl-CoA dehydrogenase
MITLPHLQRTTLGAQATHTPWQEVAEARRAELRALVDSKIRPLVEESERTQVFPVQIYRWLGEAGFLSIGAPVEQGGEGGGRTAEVMVVEELTRASAGITMSVVPFFIVRIAIWEFGTPEAIAEVGLPMIRGERIVSICMSEPDAGSDVSSISTRAVPDGDGWRISGSKMFITNGSIATDLLVVARTGDQHGSDNIGLFLLEAGQPGYTAHKLDKDASRASDTTALFFDNVFVPAHRVVGNPVSGFRNAMRVLNGERILSAARAIALARISWEDAVAWAGQHKDGEHTSLSYQNTQGPLAAATADLWLLRLALEDTCRRWDLGETAVEEASMLKTISSILSVRLTGEMQDLVGEQAQRSTSRIARNARDARLGTVAAGSEQIMHRILARLNNWPAAVQ